MRMRLTEAETDARLRVEERLCSWIVLGNPGPEVLQWRWRWRLGRTLQPRRKFWADTSQGFSIHRTPIGHVYTCNSNKLLLRLQSLSAWRSLVTWSGLPTASFEAPFTSWGEHSGMILWGSYASLEQAPSGRVDSTAYGDKIVASFQVQNCAMVVP